MFHLQIIFVHLNHCCLIKNENCLKFVLTIQIECDILDDVPPLQGTGQEPLGPEKSEKK